MDDVLQLHDDEAGPWLAAQQLRLHVVLGDSVARDCGLHSVRQEDRVLNLGEGGATWATLQEDFMGKVATWRQDAEREGRRLGTAVIWLSGNDIYSRVTGLPSVSEDILWRMQENAMEITGTLLGVAESVVVFGPIARPVSEVMPVQWEETAAFRAERRLLQFLPRDVKLVPLGRQLTKKMRRRHYCVSDCLQWYRPDGVHLNPEGYSKVAQYEKFPEWVRLHGRE